MAVKPSKGLLFIAAALFVCAIGVKAGPRPSVLLNAPKYVIVKTGSPAVRFVPSDSTPALLSQNSLFALYYQTDGNLVLYSAAAGKIGRNGDVLWSSKTHGKPAGVFVLQQDGNLVIYPSEEDANKETNSVWSPNTHSTITPRVYQLIVQDDGNMVLYLLNNDSFNRDKALWATNTDFGTQNSIKDHVTVELHDGSPRTWNPSNTEPCQRSENMKFYWMFTKDGYIKVYNANGAGAIEISNIDTGTRGPAFIQVTTSGRVIVKDPNTGLLGSLGYDNGEIKWTSNAPANKDDFNFDTLILQNDGNLVNYLHRDRHGHKQAAWAAMHPALTGPSSLSITNNAFYEKHPKSDTVILQSVNTDYTLKYQDDGNLVVYQKVGKGHEPRWASNTVGKPGSFRLRSDGQIVLTDRPNGSGNVIWSSNINTIAAKNSAKFTLSLGDDGRLLVQNGSGETVWQACEYFSQTQINQMLSFGVEPPKCDEATRT